MTTDPTTLAGILASLTAEPVRNLTTLDREAWAEATAEMQGWLNTDGTPLHITTAEHLCAEHLAASPTTPRPLARVKVARALAGLVAKKQLRLGQVQFGDDAATDPVAVLMACPDGTRLAADGYEAVVVVWWPDGVFTFTDETTAEEVSLPNLYRGRASGYARVWRNVDDAVAEFDRLKDAMRTLRRLSTVDAVEPEAGDTGKPTAAQSII